MSGSSSLDDSIDPIDRLTQEFLHRRRAGEKLAVEAFAAAHPEHAAMLRDLLPTLLALEAAKQERQSSTGGQRHPVLPPLERLGDFRIVRELGRGGMGVVFEAVQEALDRRVALKVLPQAALLTERQLSRFRREAHIAAQLHHSNIVPVFGSGESDGFHWYAMQFIAGQSLDRWREEEAKAPPAGSGAWRNRARFVARLGEQAALALHHAHGHGTLHRDIKPGNLLLDRDDNVWVTDFGLAKALEEEGLTHSGDLLGTLQYMAPEQFAGQYDVRSEVYALGITLYELLALRPAYAAKTRSELLEHIRTQSPADLRRLCPELPEDLVLVVERAIAREPGDRYADAGAFAQDLQAYLEDRPIAARRQGSIGLVWRWCRRNRAMATLAAATLVAVVGAAITGWTAYVITDDALGKAKESTTKAQQEWDRAEANQRLLSSTLSRVFDTLVGRDRVLALEEDPDTGEVVVLTPSVRPQNVALLEELLKCYVAFAERNAENLTLRLDTARAFRRVGTIQARFGKYGDAAQSYDEALRRYQFVNERDVKREIAAVYVDYGQLEQRLRRDREAPGANFRHALQLLESPEIADAKAVRFERAQVHFLLARSFEFGRGGRGRPRSPAGGRGGDPESARQHLAAARDLVDTLRREDPDDPDVRALEARCLCFVGPPRRRQREDGGATGRDAQQIQQQQRRERQFREGVDIFRELVKAHPDADEYRVALIDVLTGDPRRMWREQGSEGAEQELSEWLEAKGHAEWLTAHQPDFPDYKVYRVRVGIGVGKMLRARAVDEVAGDAAATRQTARQELQAALALADGLLGAAGAGGRDPMLAMWVADARLQLVEIELADGHLSEARAQVERLAQAALDRVPADGPMGPPFEVGLERLQELAGRVGAVELQTRLSTALERLRQRPSREPIDPATAPRPGGQPGETRRR